AADEHGALRASVTYGQGHLLREVRVVHGRRRVRPHVEHVVSLLAQRLRDLLLEQEAGVIGGDADLHRFRPTCSRAAAATLSGSNPNFFCSSLRGAEAPKLRMPTFLPVRPT